MSKYIVSWVDKFTHKVHKEFFKSFKEAESFFKDLDKSKTSYEILRTSL